MPRQRRVTAADMECLTDETAALILESHADWTAGRTKCRTYSVVQTGRAMRYAARRLREWENERKE